MANCHDLFVRYHDRVALAPSKEQSLRQSRDSIRETIRDCFRDELRKPVPKFHIQGSFAMRTTVTPEGGEFDIDDGVYLQGQPSNLSDWPSTETAHGWVASALKKRTEAGVTDKRTCVRVSYAADYHVDLPIYILHQGVPYLAEKEPGTWHVSDAKALTDWFKEAVSRNGEQLRRVVRLLKAWADHNSKSQALPSGLVLTVLVASHYVPYDRDDASFARTASEVLDGLGRANAVWNPVDRTEDLSDGREGQIMALSKQLDLLVTRASDALNTPAKERACEVWKEELGPRFGSCEGLEDDQKPLRTLRPALLRDDFRAA